MDEKKLTEDGVSTGGQQDISTPRGHVFIPHAAPNQELSMKEIERGFQLAGLAVSEHD